MEPDPPSVVPPHRTAVVAMWLTALPGPLLMVACGLIGARGMDLLLLFAGLIVTLLGFAWAGALVRGWMARARAAADWLCPAPHRMSPDQADRGWLIPFRAHWLPYRAVTDLARAADPDATPFGPGPYRSALESRIKIWWGAYEAGGPALVFVCVFLASRHQLALTLCALLYLGSLVVAAAQLGVIMRRISGWLRDRERLP